MILAGGESRRMGQNKLPLKVGNSTLLDRVHAALTPRCAEILIVGAEGRAPPGTFEILDERAGRQGPLAGIEAGLIAASHHNVIVAAGDMPFLTPNLVGHLLGLLSESATAVVPELGGRPHPLCAAYGREVLPVVSGALDRGTRSVREMLADLPGVAYVDDEELRRFGDPNLLLTNINTPKDLDRARAALREGVPPRGG